MIWTIAGRQFLDYLMTLRFAFVLVFSVLLVALGTLIQVANLEQRLEGYDAEQARLQRESGQARIFFEVRLGIGRRPPTLAFLCAGQDREMPHFTMTEVIAPPLGALGISGSGSHYELGIVAVGFNRFESGGVALAGQNPLMLSLRAVDFAFIVATFLSLLAFLLSFDSITGERESGTLPVMLANSVSRGTVLAGKWIGGAGCLALALALALGVALIVGLQSSRIALSGADWGRVELLYLTSLLFLGGLFALGMGVSSRAGRSATALVVLLLVWTVVVVLVPNVSPYVAALARPTASDEAFFRDEATRGGSVYEKLNVLAKRYPLPAQFDWRFMRGADRISGSIPYARAVREAPRELVTWYLTGTETGNGLILEAAQRNWGTYDARFKALWSQRLLAEWLARVSPAFAFTNLAERVAGTHPSAGVRFAQQAKQFYDQFVQSVRQRGGLGLHFFTPLDVNDFLPLDQYRRMWEAEGEGALVKLYAEKISRAAPIRGLPAFRFHPEPAVASVFQADLLLLALLPALFFACAYVAFVRRKVGGGL